MSLITITSRHDTLTVIRKERHFNTTDLYKAGRRSGMPVRSLNSSVLRWPDSRLVHKSICQWAQEIVRCYKEIDRIGYFGSYARGDWGVGSDLDVIIIVRASRLPFERRAAVWDTNRLPVPVDLFVYTRDEWQSLQNKGRFYQTVMREIVWIYVRDRRSP